MKVSERQRTKGIDVSLWQLVAVLVAAIACICATVPLITRYRSSQCATIYPTPISEPVVPFSRRSRYVREVDVAAAAAQCGVIPPLCLPTTTISTISPITPTTTRRPSVSTVSVTRPVITTYSTAAPTTTPNPWLNTTRPYDSWRLPTFAVPISYTLSLSCPVCFNLLTYPPIIPFTGQVTIQMNIVNATNFLVLHAKNLNITSATITSGGSGTAVVTYLREFEMIYLNFTSSTLAAGDISLQLVYSGFINQQDQTGFYREIFWKSVGELSYLLGANFQPIHARRAFPCFDEPQLQATFSLTLNHPQNSSIAVSNIPSSSFTATSTTFDATPQLSTHELSWAILPRDEFYLVNTTIFSTRVNVWIRQELIGVANANLDTALDLVVVALGFAEEYFNISRDDFPEKLDLIGVSDLVLDDKAYTSLGLLIFREEFLTDDRSLNSAERMQNSLKVFAEHLLQMWLSKVSWWNNAWFGKSLASFLAYKVVELSNPDYYMTEQFPVREMVPLMMDDAKPSTWPVSNKNLMSNDQIIDSLSPIIYNKGASLLRLLEYLVGEEKFRSAVIEAIATPGGSDLLSSFFSSLNSETILGTAVTVEEFLRSWLEERNYPLVTVDFLPGNGSSNSSVIFRQTRYLGSFSFNDSALDRNYLWKIYMECQVGGVADGEGVNLTGNIEPTTRKFLFQTAEETLELPSADYAWIKCNKDFYSYYVTEYVSYTDDQHLLWEYFDQLFSQDVFSSNDKANLINDAFVLPHGGDIVTYDQTISLVRRIADPIANYIPWSVFIWHWNYLMGVEEHSSYFANFKKFASRQSLAPFSSEINNLVTPATDHRERLIRSMLFEFLCRVQNTDALNKATEFFRQIPPEYFSQGSGNANVPPDYLATAIYYHVQNTNNIDEWDTLWTGVTENRNSTSQHRHTVIRALGAAKEIWRLKTILEAAADNEANLIETQEFFDLMVSISQNPIGRDVAWNFYRHNYEDLLIRFGPTNRLFNQLITNLAQSFENEYYYFQMSNFIQQYPSSSQSQQQAFDQILMNFEWVIDGLALALDNAIAGGDRMVSKSK